jgi:hypothetical protein
MNTVKEVCDDIKTRLDEIVAAANEALRGGDPLKELAPTLERLGRGAILPHWYDVLVKDGALPNLDGKSLGSVLEMVFVAVLERKFYYNSPMVPLRINPARGIDIPSLQLGIKSPSENYCTSEPFFSAYERLLGNDHDAVILLTDYQTRKKSPPLRIQIINQRYLAGSQIADKNLCIIAKKNRELLLSEKGSELKKVVRFLAYVNQSDWEAKALLQLLSGSPDDQTIEKSIYRLEADFNKTNVARTKKGDDSIAEDSLAKIKGILDTMPHHIGLINAADNWVIETQKDFGRYPNDNEWSRFSNGALDGVIGMSFALQWRYNFGPLFKVEVTNKADEKHRLTYR